MVAYNFKAEFAPPVVSGEKPLTMRRARKGNARHARVGDTLQLSTGARTKNRRVLATPTCTLRATVVLGPDTVVRVLDVATDGTVRSQGIAMLLAQAEQGSPDAKRWSDALAKLDGFADYAAMYAWHVSDDHPGADGRVTRELIGWGALA
jgi:hypothetical protein